MNKQDDTTLLKPRGYRRILSAGFHLYTGYFRRFFKASWQMALLYAIACGLSGTLTTIKLPEITLAIMNQMAAYQGIMVETLKEYAFTILEIVGLLLLALATLALASAPIIAKLKEHKETNIISSPPHWLSASPAMMGRSLKALFLTILVMVIPLVLFLVVIYATETVSPHFVANHWITCIASFIICTILAILLLQPLFYVQMKYLMESTASYWKTLAKGYAAGMHHWGTLFLVFFVSGMFVTLVGLVIMMPSYILNFANQEAQRGLLMGDPLGMPSHMPYLTFITYLACNFMQFYVNQIILVHSYYLYGSIETKEKEKNQLNEDRTIN